MSATPMSLDRLFNLMSEKNASDLFLSVGSPITIKINGVCVPINQDRLAPQAIVSLLAERLTDAHFRELEDSRELNIGLPVQGVGSFRLSAFLQRGSISAVIRFIPHDIPRLDQLHLPEVLKDLIMERRGPDPRRRRGRLRQVDHHRLDARPPQRARDRARADLRGPDRVPVPQQEVDHQPARNRLRCTDAAGRPAQRHAAGPGRDLHRRDPRPRHDERGARLRDVRPPRGGHAARHQQLARAEPRDQLLSAGNAPGPVPGHVGRDEGDRVAAPGALQARRPRARGRGAA